MNASNVIYNNASIKNISRHVLLEWVNRVLDTEFTKIEELCTGAAYCQLMHKLFPNTIPLQKVKFYTNVDYDFMQNFKLLQSAFHKVRVNMDVPTNKLIKGRFQDNFAFLQWFKMFYDENNNQIPYDALEARFRTKIGLKPAPTHFK